MIDLLVFAASALAFALTSRKLEPIWITAPVAFTLSGFLVVEMRAVRSHCR